MKRRITHRCISKMSRELDSGGEQIPCTGVYYSDGTIEGGCDEPCRWIMKKEGEGDPPWTAREVG